MLTRNLLLTLSLVALNSQAATLIEVRTSEGPTKVYREGTRSRMDGGDGTYTVVDSKAGTLFVIMPEERQVMDMSAMLTMAPPANNGKPVDVTLKKEGSGETIAGYKTARYSYLANGKACGTVLASEQALEDSGLQETFEIMERMAARADAMMAAFNAQMDPCQRGATRFSEQAKKIGVPMRITLNNGELISEVVRIEKNTKLPANAFEIPAGYQVQNAGQLMRQLPNIGDMMKQLQSQ